METRFNGNVVPFASNATSGERTIFGDWNTESDDINDNLNTDFISGWEAGLEGALNPYPPSQYFNAALYTVSSLVSYLYQQGIAEWNTNQDYFLNSYCTASNGKIYRAKTGTMGSPNNGNNPISDTINWELLDNNFDNNSIGINQTWKQVQASRLAGVTYTNNTNKPIFVSIYASDNGTTKNLSVDGITVAAIRANSGYNNVSVIVPPSSSYIISPGTIINTWAELS